MKKKKDLVALTFSPIPDDTEAQKDTQTSLKSNSWFWMAVLASLSPGQCVHVNPHNTPVEFQKKGADKWKSGVQEGGDMGREKQLGKRVTVVGPSRPALAGRSIYQRSAFHIQVHTY